MDYEAEFNRASLKWNAIPNDIKTVQQKKLFQSILLTF